MGSLDRMNWKVLQSVRMNKFALNSFRVRFISPKKIVTAYQAKRKLSADDENI